MKTKLEIIDETVNFYNLSNRAMSGLGCFYHTQNGKQCAVGRCLKDSDAFQEMIGKEYMYSSQSIDDLSDSGLTLDDFLKDEYKGHDIEFWKGLQLLHDSEIFWNNEGLSHWGVDEVKRLRLKYE